MSQNVLRFAKTPKTAMKTFSNTSHQMYSIFILMLNNLTICQPSSFFFPQAILSKHLRQSLYLLYFLSPGLGLQCMHHMHASFTPKQRQTHECVLCKQHRKNIPKLWFVAFKWCIQMLITKCMHMLHCQSCYKGCNSKLQLLVESAFILRSTVVIMEQYDLSRIKCVEYVSSLIVVIQVSGENHNPTQHSES